MIFKITKKFKEIKSNIFLFVKEKKVEHRITSSKEFKYISVNYFIIKSILNSLLHFYSPHRANDINRSLLSIFFSAIWLPVRNSIINLIIAFDKLSAIPYGASKIPPYRNLYYGNLKLLSKADSIGIDIRSYIWKRQALTCIIETILNKNKKSSKFNFIEIGAASGIVSLFLAEWAKKKNITYEITALEPSLPNINFLNETAYLNNLKIKIIPMAISKNNCWLPFISEGTKGLVGEGLKERAQTGFAPSMTVENLNNYISDIDYCYIDAFLNEKDILEEMLIQWPNIQSYIIEFDYGVSEETLNLLKEKSYFLEQKKYNNYVFTRK